MSKLLNLNFAARIAMIGATLSISGCMNPGMYYGRPYSQPVYSPPQAIGNGMAPGTLYIPESNAPPYAPSGSPGTYESDPPSNLDDFNRPNDRFFTPDDAAGGVPIPPDQNRNQFDSDLNSSTRYSEPYESGSEIRQVAGTANSTASSGEYGFDRKDYRWLRGILKYDSRSGGWLITYSLAARDEFGGTLAMAISQQQIDGLAEGDTVDVHGYVDQNVRNEQGRPIYRVESIERIDI